MGWGCSPALTLEKIMPKKNSTFESEKSITVEHRGGFINVPSLDLEKRRTMTAAEAVAVALKKGKVKIFGTKEAAVKAAVKRSKKLTIEHKVKKEIGAAKKSSHNSGHNSGHNSSHNSSPVRSIDDLRKLSKKRSRR